MQNTEKSYDKLGIGFGVITIMSGIGLLLMGNYLIGVSGSIVGVGLVSQNMKQMKDKGSE